MRCPRVAARHCHSRAAWASACRHYDRRARCIAGSAIRAGGEPARSACVSRSLAQVEPWDEILPVAESRGGTPRGERAALCARRTPLGCGGWIRVSRRSASLLSSFLHSWLEAQIVRIPASTAGILWRRSVRRARKSYGVTKTRVRNASRERFLTSSLPGLTRQSMRRVGMDHRVKPGGDEEGDTIVGRDEEPRS